MNIHSVTVLGAGTMGAQIALHCANAGFPVLLLDLTEDTARQGLDRARKLKPDPQFTPEAYRLVSVGGFDTHMHQIATSDWIMEAVVERLDIKQQLLARVDAIRALHALRPDVVHLLGKAGDVDVPVAEVLALVSDDKYVEVVTAARAWLIRTPLRELLPQLDPREFVQIHRGCVVRWDAIQRVDREDTGRLCVYLHGRSQPHVVSRSHSHHFKAM